MWWRKKKLSDVTTAFVTALEMRPGDFYIKDDYCMADRETNFQFWIANGSAGFKFYNSDAEFPENEREIAWNAYQKWISNKKEQKRIKATREAAIKIAMALQPQETENESSKTG